MSIPEPSGPGLPAEPRLAQAQVPAPSPSAVPTGAPTPGVSPAVLDHPGAPSMAWDPATFTGALAQLANELFRAVPSAAAPGGTPAATAPPGTAPGVEPGPVLSGLVPAAGGPGPSAASPGAVPSPGSVPEAPGASPTPAVAAPAAPAPGAPRAPSTASPPPGAAPPAAAAPTYRPELAPSPVAGSAPPDAPQARPAPGSPAGVPAVPPAAPPAGALASPFSVAPSLDALLAPLGAGLSFPLLDAVAPAPLEHTAPPAAAELPSGSAGFSPVLEEALRPTGPALFDPHALRREFPILEERVHGKRLVWLDNAATTQKPRAVIERLKHFYEHENSNIHRAAHTLAARATDAYEAARETVRRFLHASSTREVVFVRGATEGINLVAQSWGRRNVAEGDEVVITHLEHHANIVPWQQLCAEKGARLRVAPVDDRGQVLLEEYEKLLGPRTRLVSLTQVSNALGTITPAAEMVALAHRHGARVLVDGAQAVSHLRVDVQALDCDFFVFSGHKVFGPTGIGVVYGKQELLDSTPPWQGGGNMIQDVTFERTVYQPAPARFEAGTGNIADAVGLGAALDWLTRVGLETVARYEHELLGYATARLAEVPGLTLFGTAPDKAGVLSFVLAGQKTEEVGGLLDREGIAVRSGHHCAQPILRRLGVEATVRASLAPYNTCEDVDALVAALQRLQVGR